MEGKRRRASVAGEKLTLAQPEVPSEGKDTRNRRPIVWFEKPAEQDSVLVIADDGSPDRQRLILAQPKVPPAGKRIGNRRHSMWFEKSDEQNIVLVLNDDGSPVRQRPTRTQPEVPPAGKRTGNRRHSVWFEKPIEQDSIVVIDDSPQKPVRQRGSRRGQEPEVAVNCNHRSQPVVNGDRAQQEVHQMKETSTTEDPGAEVEGGGTAKKGRDRRKDETSSTADDLESKKTKGNRRPKADVDRSQPEAQSERIDQPLPISTLESEKNGADSTENDRDRHRRLMDELLAISTLGEAGGSAKKARKRRMEEDVGDSRSAKKVRKDRSRPDIANDLTSTCQLVQEKEKVNCDTEADAVIQSKRDRHSRRTEKNRQTRPQAIPKETVRVTVPSQPPASQEPSGRTQATEAEGSATLENTEAESESSGTALDVRFTKKVRKDRSRPEITKDLTSSDVSKKSSGQPVQEKSDAVIQSKHDRRVEKIRQTTPQAAPTETDRVIVSSQPPASQESGGCTQPTEAEGSVTSENPDAESERSGTALDVRFAKKVRKDRSRREIAKDLTSSDVSKEIRDRRLQSSGQPVQNVNCDTEADAVIQSKHDRRVEKNRQTTPQAAPKETDRVTVPSQPPSSQEPGGRTQPTEADGSAKKALQRRTEGDVGDSRSAENVGSGPSQIERGDDPSPFATPLDRGDRSRSKIANDLTSSDRCLRSSGQPVQETDKVNSGTKSDAVIQSKRDRRKQKNHQTTQQAAPKETDVNVGSRTTEKEAHHNHGTVPSQPPASQEPGGRTQPTEAEGLAKKDLKRRTEEDAGDQQEGRSAKKVEKRRRERGDDPSPFTASENLDAESEKSAKKSRDCRLQLSGQPVQESDAVIQSKRDRRVEKDRHTTPQAASKEIAVNVRATKKANNNRATVPSQPSASKKPGGRAQPSAKPRKRAGGHMSPTLAAAILRGLNLGSSTNVEVAEQERDMDRSCVIVEEAVVMIDVEEAAERSEMIAQVMSRIREEFKDGARLEQEEAKTKYVKVEKD